VWLDVEQMKGSVVDAMSEAIESAAVVLFGVSERYKESANCRLELQYAAQMKVDRIPLMMQEGYQAQGWLGLLLGQSLWHAFSPSAVDTPSKFATKMDQLTHEISARGQRDDPQNQPLASTRTPPHAGSADATGSATAAGEAGTNAAPAQMPLRGSREHIDPAPPFSEQFYLMLDRAERAERAERERAHRQESAAWRAVLGLRMYLCVRL
jgi:hypothetical protein